MDLVEVNKLVENRHPWELARASFFNRLILEAAGREGPVRILDAGCGDTWFSRQLIHRLPASSEVVGWDIALDDDLLRVFSADLPEGIFLTNVEPAGTFDVIVCLDVLEHVPDDLAFLGDMVGRFLRPGGWFIASVPAWPSLFSKHDHVLRHYRRYKPSQGKALMIAAGLNVVRKGGLFHGLSLVRLMQIARWGRTEPLADPGAYQHPDQPDGPGVWNAPALVTSLITSGLRAEALISRAASAARVELPGLSWWALCQKP